MEIAVMNIEKGEEIIASLVSGHIPGTGYYKFLAKKTNDNIYVWAHFTERDNGFKEKVFKGEVKSLEELDLLVSIMNKTLKKVFGEMAEMKQGKWEMRSITGHKLDDTIN